MNWPSLGAPHLTVCRTICASEARASTTHKPDMTSRTAQIEKLYKVIFSIYQQRNDPHPEVAAQFHVEDFIGRHKEDRFLDDLLQMEIEDCSRALAA